MIIRLHRFLKHRAFIFTSEEKEFFLQQRWTFITAANVLEPYRQVHMESVLMAVCFPADVYLALNSRIVPDLFENSIHEII